ncbi:hypothetical protein V9T40_003611 [Parthenolecanium corni]|uniref:Mannose-6-phosphate isomerase n=1 Tax=Parthenolecanium corni TaxID=536013 RepID=A0AAN9TTP9_9HEMI
MALELLCPIKTYHWGKVGRTSLVAYLKQNADFSFIANPNESYAELWMGTHPSGPAIIKDNDMPLENWILQKPSILGEKVLNTFGNNLPFLFKILSINMPLSIQVHPSQEKAKELNSSYPDVYKDPNHKPELAIALSKFEALCGFRPYDEIKQFLIDIPELSKVIGEELVEKFVTSDESSVQCNLKFCFTSLMTASKTFVKSQLDAFLQRVRKMTDSQSSVLGDLLTKIYDYFPGDVGCFCIYFLNYLILEPDEAIFLPANEPHAYISGDCVECMACSDNVIRAGLTPKYRDVETLCEILNYSTKSANSKILFPEIENDFSTVYKPPVPEFAVCKINVSPGKEYHLIPRDSSSIFIVIDGSASLEKVKISKGQVFFLNANNHFVINVSTNEEPLTLFQAFVNV